ncbi:hypothetical protein STCU_10241 [Strigomonas culicis]|uniref:Uncharacterized protein n=1 Tax=Strigomonas culicis TaxID=28005 RepID=S9TIX7_9TRYP|nr:hypothetical protein STCU_10241 [Strigomonas culicis]|eukprot:EPY18027.1 hypothetical protein STCU_10241 [Strigomonas culicis]
MLSLLHFSRRGSEDSDCGLPSLTTSTKEPAPPATGRYLVECSSLPPFKERFRFFESSPADDATPASPSALKASTSAVSLVTGECGLSGDGSSSSPSMRSTSLYEHDRLPSMEVTAATGPAEVPTLTTDPHASSGQRPSLQPRIADIHVSFCDEDTQTVAPPRTDARVTQKEKRENATTTTAPGRLPKVPQLKAKELQYADVNERDDRSHSFLYYTHLLLSGPDGGAAVDRIDVAVTNGLPVPRNSGNTHTRQFYRPRSTDMPSSRRSASRRPPLVGFTQSTEFLPAFKAYRR